MKCKICNIRKPRRYCPGVVGDICSICCGTEREVTVNCPLDCAYLREAHAHEKLPGFDREHAPNADIEVSDGFLRQHEQLMIYVGFALNRSVAKTPEVVDSDLRDALDALTQTYRTLTKGLYYESRPTNPYAARIVDQVRQGLEEYSKDLREQGKTLRDSEVLGILVMYQRLALTYNNGRPKCRAFLGILVEQFRGEQNHAGEVNDINGINNEPRLIQL